MKFNIRILSWDNDNSKNSFGARSNNLKQKNLGKFLLVLSFNHSYFVKS